MVPDAIHAGGFRVAHSVLPWTGGPGRRGCRRREKLTEGRKVHASVRRTGRPLTDDLFARAGEPSVHLLTASRRWNLPDQKKCGGRGTRPDAPDQKRSGL